MCGLPGATSVEHIVPQSYYLDGVGDDPPRAPAHVECNRSTAPAEDALRNVLAAAPLQRGDRRLLEKTVRALGRPEAARLRTEFLSKMVAIPGVGGTVGTRPEHVAYVLAKIAKGFIYLDTGNIILPGDVRWTVRTTPDDVLASLDLPPPMGGRVVGHVVEVAWWSIPAMPAYAMVRFYGAVTYAVMAVRRERVFQVREFGAKYLPWPRPRIRRSD